MEDAIFALIPIVAVGGFFTWMIALSPIGKAYAERLRAGAQAGRHDGTGNEDVLAAVEELRREVAELAERVDFTERMLGQQRAADKLGPGRP